MRHKPLREQVIVVTGASSGIGLTIARIAAERGARVVLAARSEDVLARIAAELGSRATYVAADVGAGRRFKQ
jgi:NADP-dependent 3-hydroxy acid dehydrogenase YdfG